MRKILTFVLAAFATLASGGVASAQMVTGQSPSSIVKILQKAGYKAELSKDETGDPLIKSASSGSNFAVLFYGCKQNKECTRIQFSSSFTDYKNSSLSALNAWNAKNYFGRAYQTDKGAARLEMDLDLDDGGMSPALFEDNLEWWVSIMANFEKHISGG